MKSPIQALQVKIEFLKCQFGGQFAVQELERNGAISDTNLLGEKNRTHAAFSQLSDKAEAAGKSSSKLCFCFHSLSSKGSAIAGTEGIVIRVSTLASGAGLHMCQ